jgi:uncharacterized protein (TIGR02145 family)
MIYSWVAAQNVCPVGWHLPSKEDFDQLFLTVGGPDKKKAYNALTANDTIGFKALLGGYFSGTHNDDKPKCYFSGAGQSVGFWTSTAKNKKGAKSFLIGDNWVEFTTAFKSGGYYVRCIQD